MPSVSCAGVPNLRTHLDDAVSALSWGADGALLWAGTATGTLQRLDRSGPTAAVGPLHRRRIVDIAVDPTTGTVASADGRGHIVLQQPSGGTIHLDAGSRARALAWSPEGSRLAITSQAAGLLVVDEDARRICSLPPSRRHLCAAWHQPAGPWQLAVAGAGALTWLDTSLPDAITHTSEREGVTLTIASTAGGWLALGDLRGTVTMANGELGVDARISGWPDPIRHLAWVGGAQHLVVCGGDQLTAWEPPSAASADVETRAPEPVVDLVEISPDGTPITCIASHPWLPDIAIGTELGTVARWTPSTGIRTTLGIGAAAVSSLGWDPMGEHLAIGLRSGAVLEWAQPARTPRSVQFPST